MKRFLSIVILVLVIFNSALVTVSHATMEASDYLSAYCVYIDNSGNTISINYEVIGTGKMDYVGVTQIYLYERVDSNSDWSLVQTYLSSNPSYTSTMLGTNTSMKMDNVDYSGNLSYQYKAYVTVYAEKNGGSDSRNLIVYY
jgi:hypothetical protein